MLSLSIVALRWNTVVDCYRQSQAGIMISEVVHFEIENVTFQGCGVQYAAFLAGVVLENCVNSSVRNSGFTKSRGSGLVVYSGYTANQTEGEIQVCNRTICQSFNVSEYFCALENSRFWNNGQSPHLGPVVTSLTPTVIGGGTMLYSTSTQAQFTVVIAGCEFYNNSAEYGGALALVASQDMSRSDCHAWTFLHAADTTFSGNLAFDGAGYYEIGAINADFSNCSFVDNHADRSAGAAHIIGPNLSDDLKDCISLFDVWFKKCDWLNNTAYRNAVIYLSVPADLHNSRLHLEENSFDRNYLNPEIYDTDACIIYVTRVDIDLSDSVFQSNLGSGICLDFADAHLSNTVTFADNFAYRGGGINLKGTSVLILSSGADVNFTENLAVYGGAIYKEENTELDTLCIFSFTDQDYEIVFDQNFAELSGYSIFYQDIDVENLDCPIQQILDNPRVVFSPNDIQNQVTSSASSVTFLSPIKSSDGQYTLRTTLGELLVFEAIVLDLFGHETSTLVYVSLLRDAKPVRDKEEVLIHGFTAFTLQNGTTNTNLFFTGPNVSDVTSNSLYDYSLQFFRANNLNDSIVLNLQFEPCKLGFFYDNSSMACSCLNSGNIICDEDRGLACIRQGYWTGVVSGEYLTAPCISGYCNNTLIRCESCTLEGSENYCVLQETEEQECIGNKTGAICTACVANYSLTYAGYDCVPESTCQGANVLILLFAFLAFLLFNLLFLVLLLKLDNRISSAYLYCFIYYYSIVDLLLPAASVPRAHLVLLSVIESFTQINPIFLGYVPICFFSTDSNTSPLVMQVFNYIYALLVAVVLFTALGLSRFCPRLMKFSDNTPVRAISLLVLLSFTDITETSFYIINPLQYENGEGTYVALDPSALYFETTAHIILCIIAIFLIVFVSITFTAFLLFAPLIMRRFNLTKIKPFLDEFQGLYKDKYRWMAGYYFLCRLINYAVIIEPTTNQLAGIYILQMLSVAIALFHCAIQPYKSTLLNVVDGVFLIDIVFVSLLQGRTAETVLGSLIWLRDSVTAILTLIPFVYIVLLILVAAASKVHIIRRAFVSCWSRVKTRVLVVVQSRSPNEDMLTDPTANLFPEREPLLEIMARDGNGIRSRLPTMSTFQPSFSDDSPPGVMAPTEQGSTVQHFKSIASADDGDNIAQVV